MTVSLVVSVLAFTISSHRLVPMPCVMLGRRRHAHDEASPSITKKKAVVVEIAKALEGLCRYA